MFRPLYPFIWIVKKSKALSALAMRLTRITGKSKYPVHPKHLIDYEPPWYLARMKKSDKVLDLGCNNGQHSLKVAPRVKKVVGLDRDERQLKIAGSLAKDLNVKNVSFNLHDLERQLPLKNGSFDKVLCLDVLEHVVKRKKLLKEIYRVLKPKGLAFVAIPNLNTSWKRLQKRAGIKNVFADPDHKKEYSLDEARKVIEDAGFKILSLEPVVYDTAWVGVFDFIGGLSLTIYSKISTWKKNKVKNNLKESTGFRIMAQKVK